MTMHIDLTINGVAERVTVEDHGPARSGNGQHAYTWLLEDRSRGLAMSGTFTAPANADVEAEVLHDLERSGGVPCPT